MRKSSVRHPGRRELGRRGNTIVTVIVVVVILFLLAALFIPAVARSREAARRTQCRNNLKQIALAVNNYEDSYKFFPPAVQLADPGAIVEGCNRPEGRLGGFSWRVLILPHLESTEYKASYDNIDL